MATPAFTGADYLSGLQQYTPQQIIGELESLFPEQTFVSKAPGNLQITGIPEIGGISGPLISTKYEPKWYDTFTNIPGIKPAFTDYLFPAITSLRSRPAVSVDTRPIAKAGPTVDPIIGETQQPPPATVPLEPSPRIAEADQPSIPTERQTLESALTATPTTPTQAATPPTPAPVVDRVAEPTPPQSQPNSIDTRTAQEKATDEYFDLVNRVEFGGQEILKRPLTRDPVATTAITREAAAERPPTKGLVLDMPLESRYPDSTGQQYLRGGLDAFAYSGPQGYADVRQRLLGEPADVFTGPEVDLSLIHI